MKSSLFAVCEFDQLTFQLSFCTFFVTFIAVKRNFKLKMNSLFVFMVTVIQTSALETAGLV